MKNLQLKPFVLLIVSLLLIFFGPLQTGVNPNNVNLQNRSKENLKSAAFESIGGWIIIGGDRSDHDKVELIKNGCNKTYETLINLGFDADDIYYLGPNVGVSSSYVDAFTSPATVQYALTSWAQTKVDETHALGIYMFDHGGTGHMCIPGAPELTDTDLNNNLDYLETQSGCNRIILIYEACLAGSFINPVSKNNRIIITSTDSDHNSKVNGDWTWAAFSEGFWSALRTCKTLGKAFEEGVANVKALGYADVQKPLIDDDHNEVGHEVDAMGELPHGGDGNDALNIQIGTSCISIYVHYIPLRFFINFSAYLIPIWAVINNNTKVEKVYARVIPPNWTPSPMESDNEGSKLSGDNLPIIELYDQDGDGNYSKIFDRRDYINFMSEMGDYKINIIAETEDGTIAKIESTHVTLNDNGQTPPDTTPPTVLIKDPDANSILSGTIKIGVEGDDDQSLDKIRIFLDGNLLKEENMPPYYPYPEVTYNLDTNMVSNGVHNITAVAIDKANQVTQTSISVTFQNEKIPSFPIIGLSLGMIIGIVITHIFYIRKRIQRMN
jgi:hypothetical protein